MKTFRFYQDVEVVTIQREYYDIPARSLEDARKKASEVDSLSEIEDAEFIESEDVTTEELDIHAFQNPDVRGIYDSEDEEREDWDC